MKRCFLSLLIAMTALAASARDAARADFDSLARLCDRSRQTLSVPGAYRDWIAGMQQIADRTADPRLRWLTLLWKADMYRRADRLDLARPIILQAAAMVDSTAWPHDCHMIQWTRALILDPDDAVDLYRLAQQQLKYYSAVGDSAMMAEMHRQIVSTYACFHRHDKAVEHLDISNRLFRSAGLPGSAAINEALFIGERDFVGRGDTLRRLYPRLLDDFLNRRDTVSALILMFYASDLDIDPEAAARALRLAGQTGSPSYTADALNAVGRYWLRRDEPRRAIPCFYRALDLVPQGSGNRTLIVIRAWKGLEQSYERLGRLDSAYIAAMKWTAVSDSLNVLNHPGRFQALYEELAIEREESLIEAEKQKERNKLTIIVLVFAILMLASGWLAWRFHSRRLLREAENSHLADCVEREQLKREIYRRRSQESERQLTANSLLLIEKRRMIEHINSTIEQQGASGAIDPETSRELLEFVNHPGDSEQYQQQFYEYFNRVYPDFFSGLRERFPRLTKGDLRLCAYIRMRLDNKQIAQILSVSPDAVKKARYRLRAKLGLPTSASLEDYLLSI